MYNMVNEYYIIIAKSNFFEFYNLNKTWVELIFIFLEIWITYSTVI